MFDIQNLKKTLSEIANKASRFSSKAITEQDTKNALIEPVLSALGWAKSDLDLVRAEYRHTSKDNPVDYALFSQGQPVLFVEAKALDGSIVEHKVVSQVISYANVSGVRWALITNGREWALYKVFADVQGEQKRLFSVDVGDPAAVDWLRWIVPERLAGNDLDNVWRHCFAERRVRHLLRTMIADRDSDMVKLLAQRCGLAAQDVTAGLHHLRVTFDEPEPGPLTFAEALGSPLPDSAPVPQPRISTARAKQPAEPVAPPKKSIEQPHAAVLVAPVLGSKPVRFWIGDRSWQVKSWRDLLINTCAFLAERRPKEFELALTAEEFQGSKRRLLARTAEGFRSPVQVTGGFIELNLSAGACVDLVERLLVFCGVDPNTAGYESQDDAIAGQ